MTRRMYRYEVPVDDQSHLIPLSGLSDAYGPLHVEAVTAHLVEFWAEQDTNALTRARAFQVFGTGHPLPDGATWVGTCTRLNNGLVWHLYEVVP
jgi:hypothetical protein